MGRIFASLVATLSAIAPIDGVSIGVEGDRNTWRIDFKQEATQQQRDDALAAMLAWTEPPAPITFNEWLALFTADERAWAFASNDPTVREMIARGSAANAIDLSSPTVAGFLDLVISLGSPLTVGRKAEVLAGTPPA
jgi:hypothetical protein